MINKDTIQTIIETARIDEVVGDFVSLKRRGVNYIGLCPFHNEKTPSFTVSPQKGIYKCFGCGKGGNAVNFLMEHEQYSYPEALKFLAKKYNIQIEEEEQTPEQVKALNEKESLFHVTDLAAKYFAGNLFDTEQGKAVGLSYFKERGFREDTIKKFHLGYANDSWEGFTQYAIKQGFNPEYLEKTGLSIFKDNKKYDRFRARVMFPVHNLSGRVLGFGGRILTSEKNKPKYVNSPETDIYHKGKILYGIYFAKSSIISTDNCYLVEGYTDVISLHQAGIENVVASSGTSLTTDQIRLIRRYTSNITILYDGDEAGIKASFRGIDMIFEQGMDVKIVTFPLGEDPDSFVRKHRTSEVQDFIKDKSLNFILFKTNLLLKEAADDPIKKAGLIKEIVGSVSLIPDQITRNVYLRECAELMNIEEQTLMNELNRLRRKNYDKKIKERAKEQAFEIPEPDVVHPEISVGIDLLSTEYQEKDIIRLMMMYSNRELSFELINKEGFTEKKSYSVAKFIVRDLNKDKIEFQNKLYKKIFDIISDEIETGKIPDEKFFLNHADEEISNLAIDFLNPKYELNNWEKVGISVTHEEEILKYSVLHAILSFKLKKIERAFDKNQKQIAKATDETDLGILMNSQKSLLQKKIEISAYLGRIILR